jgi:peptidoglycan/LPS O-acetylase OafA/YrhL
VLLILTVFVFHSLRFFNLEDWNVKSANTYLVVEILVIFISRWMMPAIILISGIAAFYALGKRRAGRFLQERSLRLLVPLLVGLLTHVPFQVYLWQITHKEFNGSFWQWYPGIFSDLLQLEGRFNWLGCHLWYLEVLFIFSLVCLPLFIWLRHGRGKQALAWLGSRFSAPGALYLPVLPIILLSATLDPDSGSLAGMEFGGWNLPSYLLFFLSGFAITSSQAAQESIRRIRWFSLVTGVLTFFIGSGLIFALTGGDSPFGSPVYLVWTVISSLSCWACVLGILGFGMQRLNNPAPALAYANEAVLPFYILHQPVLLVAGFFVLDWAIPDLLKWAVILAVSFALILALYEFLIRRANLLRVLFGMKPVHREAVVRRPVAHAS